MGRSNGNPFRFFGRWQRSLSKRFFWRSHLEDAKADLRYLTQELPNTEMLLALAFVWRGKGFYESLKLKQNMKELLGFVKMLQQQPLNRICEIGTFRGGTLFVWCRIAQPEATIISIDLPGGEFGGGYNERSIPFFESFCQPEQKLECIRGSSHDPTIRDDFASRFGSDKLDFLFIDGDHSYEGVKKDFDFYSQFVKQGGYIGFHDIVHRPKQPDIEVHRFWNELKEKYECHEFIEDTDERRAIGIGLIRFESA